MLSELARLVGGGGSFVVEEHSDEADGLSLGELAFKVEEGLVGRSEFVEDSVGCVVWAEVENGHVAADGGTVCSLAVDEDEEHGAKADAEVRGLPV